MRRLCLSVLAFVTLGLASVGSAADAPNIVLILSDDQAWTDYSFMGHPDIRTPNLDALAKESVVFKRGYVPTALCRPSLMTLITGHYAHHHRVTGNDPSPKYAQRDSDLYNQRRAALIANIDRFETVPELLGEKGYLSHQSGKWWEGNFKRGGFTHGMTRGFPQKGGRHGDDGLKIGRNGMEPVTSFIDDAVAQKKPFFMWYAPFLPHTPHNPPERILKKYREQDLPLPVAKYYANCEWFDETCGQLIDILEDRNLRDDTLIVYVTDNGWINREDRSAYAPRSKQSANEGGTRQPIMYSWPGVIPPGDRGNQLASSIDIVPTMLASAGADIPENLPGLNLLPILKSGEATPRKEVLGEGFAHDIADVNNPQASLLYRWIVKDEWKLLLTYDGEVNRYASSHPRTEKRPQLYNLLEDPHENKNLASENPEVVGNLAGEISKWWPVTERKVLESWE